VQIPEAPFVHVFVAKGAVDLEDHRLQQGDCARLTSASHVQVSGRDVSEIIVWEMHSGVAG
jgi:hypothetical protein